MMPDHLADGAVVQTGCFCKASLSQRRVRGYPIGEYIYEVAHRKNILFTTNIGNRFKIR